MSGIRIKVKKPVGDYDVGASKMLGDPVLPEGMLDELPPTAMFLMQIRLEDIKDLDKENKLPHRGYLYFFLDTENDIYDLKPIVKYSEKEPKGHITEFNKAVDGFEEYSEDFLIEFEECEDSESGNKLLGFPGDWQFQETTDELLFQLDPMDSEEMNLFPTFDGYMYFFFGEDKTKFDEIKFVEDFS